MSWRLELAAALCLVLLGGASLAAGGSLKPLPLSQRMLHAGELAGFKPGAASFVSDPSKWARDCPKGEAERLKAAGFVAGASTHLSSKLDGRDAISFVARFRTPAAARADVTSFVTNHPKCTTANRLSSYSVPGIPDAKGLAAKRSDGVGYDILFSDGPFSYDVGAFTVDPKGPPTQADVVKAATALYRRTHGHPAP